MKDYVVCEKRGSHPRIHVKICQQRCEQAETCQNFQEYIKACPRDPMPVSPTAGDWSQPEGMAPAAP